MHKSLQNQWNITSFEAASSSWIFEARMGSSPDRPCLSGRGCASVSRSGRHEVSKGQVRHTDWFLARPFSIPGRLRCARSMFCDGFVVRAGPPAVLKVNVFRRVCYPSGSRLIGALWGRHSQVGSLPCAGHLLDDGAGVLRRALWEHMYHVNQHGKCQLDFDSPCRCKL